jgi:hypothetical protein
METNSNFSVTIDWTFNLQSGEIIGKVTPIGNIMEQFKSLFLLANVASIDDDDSDAVAPRKRRSCHKR